MLPTGKTSRVQAEDHVTHEPSCSSTSSSVAPVVSSSKNEDTPASLPTVLAAAATPPVQLQSTVVSPPETNGVVTPEQTPPIIQEIKAPQVPKKADPSSTNTSPVEKKEEPVVQKTAQESIKQSTCLSTTPDKDIKSSSGKVPEEPKPAKKDENHAAASETSAVEVKQPQEAKKSESNAQNNSARSNVNSRENSEPPAPKASYSYKEGNWSPLNPSGAKAYDKDLLLQIKNSIASKGRPEHLPDLDVVKNEFGTSRTYDKSSASKMVNMGASDFTPSFMMPSGNRNKGGFVAPYRGPNSSQSRNKKTQKIIEAKPSAAKSNLKTTDNAWVAASKKVETELDELTYCKNSVTGLLNKLCPENYDKLKGLFRQLILKYEKYSGVLISLIFEKAISEQHFSPTYAKLCKSVTENLKQDKDDPVVQTISSFKRNLLVKCQVEFERTHKFGGYHANKEASEKAIKKCKDEEERKRLQSEHDEKFIDKLGVKRAELAQAIKNTTDENKLMELKEEIEYQENLARKRSIGLIKFVGELYKESLLTPKIMLGLISMFGNVVNDNNSAEALCKLFTTIGERLYKSIDDAGKSIIRDAIEKCRRQTTTDSIDSRIKFLLLDIIELFDNNFVAKHQSQKQVGPSTKQEIHNKMIQEEQDERIAIANTRPNDNRRGGNRGSMNRDNYHTPESDVWKTVVSNSNSSKKNSLRNFNARHSDNGGEPTRLGPGGGFSAWSHGASGGLKDIPKSSSNDQRQGNRYNLLQEDDMPTPDFRRSGHKSFTPNLIRHNPFKNSASNDQDMMQHNSYGDRDYRSGM